MRFIRFRTTTAALAGLLAMLSTSCDSGGRKFYPVRGQVLIDGKPGQYVNVVLQPVNSPDTDLIRPSGAVQADGSFVIRTFVASERVVKEGAPAGEYIVSCEWFHPDDHKSPDLADPLPDRFKGRYSDPHKSGLRVVVEERANDVAPFQLVTK